MARIDNAEVFGLESSIFRSGYPMRTNPPSAIEFKEEVLGIKKSCSIGDYQGNPHIRRAIKLANAKGGGHDQFLTGVVVNFDLTISNKAWVEAERYTFLNFISSMSSMHKASALNIRSQCNAYTSEAEIAEFERLQKIYNETDEKEFPDKKKEAYLNMVYNLPSGFELMAAMTTNYRCLKNIYAQRRHHRLPDWHLVCDWIEQLPMAGYLITGEMVET